MNQVNKLPELKGTTSIQADKSTFSNVKGDQTVNNNCRYECNNRWYECDKGDQTVNDNRRYECDNRQYKHDRQISIIINIDRRSMISIPPLSTIIMIIGAHTLLVLA